MTMDVTADPVSTRAALLRRDGAAWASAALGTVILCLVFRQEIAAAMSVWSSSTAYGHCWLVLPIAGWLLWERRDVLPDHPACPAPLMCLLAVPLALGWVAASWLGIMEGRQFCLVGFVQVLLLAALGWRCWWALSAAFLYLVFLVPFGAFLTPALQHFTTGFIEAGLRLFDIPFDADAFQITIPEGRFYVAEACAGLRFLIASVAFGVLYAVTMFRSPVRRVAFIAVSCVVPVLANGVRALGIVLLGHVLGSAEAGAADHLIYGWVFFSAVIILLALSGLPFREAVGGPATGTLFIPSASRHRRAALGCAAVIVFAVCGPLLAGMGAEGKVAVATRPELVPPAGCTARPLAVDGAAATLVLDCGLQQVRIRVTSVPAGADPARVLTAARGPAMQDVGGDLDTVVWRTAGPPAVPWMLVRAQDTGRVAAYAIRVDEVQGVGGVHDRLRILGNMFGQGHAPATAWSVSVTPGGPEDEMLLKTVLTGLSP